MIGMMWFEPNPGKSPAEILAEALAYYTTKYGLRPTLARVSLGWPEMNGDTPDGLRIERVRHVLPRTVWLIVEQESALPVPAL